jgi:prepilin-type processing-associated H-X9-DG protein
VGVKELAPEKRLSWIAALMPEFGLATLEKQMNRAEAWDSEANRGAGTAVLKGLLCPSLVGASPIDGRGLEAWSVDGRGLLHYPGMAGFGADAARFDRSDPHAGIFAYDEATPASAVKDGTSNVLLLLETSQNIGPWIAGGPTSVRGVDPQEQPYLGVGRPFGGAHRGGANAAFADGHWQFLSEKINPTVLEMLAAIADGRSAPGP